MKILCDYLINYRPQTHLFGRTIEINSEKYWMEELCNLLVYYLIWQNLLKHSRSYSLQARRIAVTGYINPHNLLQTVCGYKKN